MNRTLNNQPKTSQQRILRGLNFGALYQLVCEIRAAEWLEITIQSCVNRRANWNTLKYRSVG